MSILAEGETWGAAAVGSPHLCQARAYIYCGYSKHVGIAYIGMTVGGNGIFGRWGDHLGRALEKSSFRRRLHEFDDSAWGRLDDLVILWAEIGTASEFLTVETSHREGVEYLVQRQLRTLLAREKPSLTVISKVRSNRTVQLPMVQAAANEILGHFKKHFNNSE